MDLDHLKVEYDNRTGTIVFVNGNRITNVRAISFSQDTETVPTATLEVYAFPDIDIQADVTFKFSPESYTDAAKLLIAGARSDASLRKGLVSSIESALKDTDMYEFTPHGIAEHVARRLLNED